MQLAASRHIQHWNESRVNSYQLRVVSRLFGTRRVTPVSTFVETTKRYGAELELVVTLVLPDRRVRLMLPRLRVDPPNLFSARQALCNFSMGLDFSGRTDFGGMLTNAVVMIVDVYQKAFVQVHEDGTEAAAATAVLMAPAAAA